MIDDLDYSFDGAWTSSGDDPKKSPRSHQNLLILDGPTLPNHLVGIIVENEDKCLLEVEQKIKLLEGVHPCSAHKTKYESCISDMGVGNK